MPITLATHEYGDSGMLFDVLGDDDETCWQAAQAIGAGLRTAVAPGLLDVVASYRNVFVAFDPRVTSHAAIATTVDSLASHMPARAAARTLEVPVVYGGEFGPDLDDVARACGISPDEVVALHTSKPWTVRFAASPAGAPFLDGSHLPVSVPRLATPRQRVVPGSVALSGRQCAIYATPSPGGWQLIGRTPAVLFDVSTPPYLTYQPGDRFQFVAVSPDEWATYAMPPREASR